ncbi:MAG TPA: hypothetical protein DCR04_09030 [Flavobacteriales bacterium]|nr:hypothetical protein [Flavobacteriales bacterium]
MFGLFKKKTERVKLNNQYNKLMKEAFELSKINRTASDQKYAQADAIQKKMDSLP